MASDLTSVRLIPTLGQETLALCQAALGEADQAILFQVRRRDTIGIVPQEGLLWGVAGTKADPRWCKAFWTKLIGPFNGKTFQSMRDFWLFWLGETRQAVGFLWDLWRQKLAVGDGVRGCGESKS